MARYLHFNYASNSKAVLMNEEKNVGFSFHSFIFMDRTPPCKKLEITNKQLLFQHIDED